MTEEEAAELGWEGEELRAYMLGRARASARVAEILSAPWTPPAEETAQAPAGPTEERAQQLAAALMAEDQAAAAAIRAREAARAGESVTVVEDRPGDVPSPHQRRQWALQRIAEEGIVLTPDNGPRASFVTRLPDGQPVITRSVTPPRMFVITPDNERVMSNWFASQRRETENRLLIARYGEPACRAAGIL